MSVRVSVRNGWEMSPPTPHPIAFLWVNNRIIDFFDLGKPIRRVKWLPIWIPFNRRIDRSFAAQAECLEVLKQYGEKLALAERGGIEGGEKG